MRYLSDLIIEKQFDLQEMHQRGLARTRKYSAHLKTLLPEFSYFAKQLFFFRYHMNALDSNATIKLEHIRRRIVLASSANFANIFWNFTTGVFCKEINSSVQVEVNFDLIERFDPVALKSSIENLLKVDWKMPKDFSLASWITESLECGLAMDYHDMVNFFSMSNQSPPSERVFTSIQNRAEAKFAEKLLTS
jgi:hypothetical protein